MSQTRLNLHGVTSLLVDSDSYTRGLVAQMLRGFGMEPSNFADDGKQAKNFLKHQCPDLCIVEAVLPDMTSADLIKWVRHLKGPIRFMPTIVLTGYTQLRMVAAARDGGANIVIRKPVSPKILFDRLLWIARVQRPFVETDDYVGPDRRFRNIEPPDGKLKRDTDQPEPVDDEDEDGQSVRASANPSATGAPKWVAT